MSLRSRPQSQASQFFADRVIVALDRFLHIEALSGIVLFVATAAALIWANSPASSSYDDVWHTPVVLGFGSFVSSQTLHFWVNDGLMTFFFLVVGLEIRREIHEGALASLRLAALPIAAALGGIVMPALIYSAFNVDPELRQGWAVPTATDIAFAVGVLALLGKAVPPNVRVLLLALAVIDDIAAVIIIALFYSEGVSLWGFALVGAGVMLVVAFQRSGIRSAYAYLIPGTVVWLGMLQSGVHPTLAGIVLGLMTPVTRPHTIESLPETTARALSDFEQRRAATPDPREWAPTLRQLRNAHRELLTPVVRVQMALHPWVAFVVMPVFALANAGIVFTDTNIGSTGSFSVAAGVAFGLVFGKPSGILLASWIVVRTGWGTLPAGLTWRGIFLVGVLAGIGFTMSIFIANLAFSSAELLGAAKLGVLIASAIAGIVGLSLGRMLLRNS